MDTASPEKSSDWSVDLLDDGIRYGDDGREVHVKLAHRSSGLGLEAVVAYYGTDGETVVLDLYQNDLALDVHTAHRLIGKLAARYMPQVGVYGDVGLTAHVDLRDVVTGLYKHSADADFVVVQIETAVRSFSTT